MLYPEVIESKEPIIIEIETGAKKTAFHREPGMPSYSGGYIAVNNSGEVPTAAYYEVETPGRIGWGLIDAEAIDKGFGAWERGETATPVSPSEHTVFSLRWEKSFEPETRTLSVETVDKEGFRTLTLKAI